MQQARTLTVNGRQRSYQVFVPPHEPGAMLPAIILFHGAQRGGASLVEHWMPLAREQGIILIGPEGTDKSWNLRDDGMTLLDAVADDAVARYAIDPKRMYLFGHSAGGIFTLYMAIGRSQRFAAAAVHAAMFYIPAHHALIGEAERKIPVAFLIGTDDHLFPLEEVGAAARAFAAQDHPAALYVLEGHNHWYYDNAPFINARAWAFLSRTALP